MKGVSTTTGSGEEQMEGGEQEAVKEKLLAPAIDTKPDSPIGLTKALLDPDHSDTSRFCFALAFFNKMTGVTAILVYIPIIFSHLQAKDPKFTISLANRTYFLIGAITVGGIISTYCVFKFSRRVCFIGGHASIGIFLWIAGLTISHGDGLSCFICLCILQALL